MGEPAGSEISMPSVFRFNLVPGMVSIPKCAVTTPEATGQGSEPRLFSKLIDISLPSGVDSKGVYVRSR